MGVAREPWQIERTFLEAIRADPDDEAARVVYADSVSYTHLTLPTKA